MGRKLTVTLAIALLMLVLAPIASADLITTPDGILVIPDGSQVTAVFARPPLLGLDLGVDFAFEGGTGTTSGNFFDGDQGTITFTVPVTNLSFTAIMQTEVMSIQAEIPGVPFFSAFVCSDLIAPHTPCPGQVHIELGGLSVSGLTFGMLDGFGGIESLSFTVDAGDPPTNSLIFLGIGLIGLFVSSRRKVPVCA